MSNSNGKKSIEMDEARVSRSALLLWFTQTLREGAKRKLTVDDLPALPETFRSDHCKLLFTSSCKSGDKKEFKHADHSIQGTSIDWLLHLTSADEKNKAGVLALVGVIARCYGWDLLIVGILKALTTALSFSGPVLLGYIVSYLEQGVTVNTLETGLLLTAVLGGSSIFSALLNTNYNVRTLTLKLRIQTALTRVLFSRCITLPSIAWKDLHASDAMVSNLVQVDVEQVANCVRSIHDLWALPAQICVAFALLYLNIQVGFLAGVGVIVVMIPLNSLIAKQFGRANEGYMKAKDQRVNIVTEALRSVTSMKMCGLEAAVLVTSHQHRKKELHYLSVRKYLDAGCVFLWSTTPVIVPFVTFVTTVSMGIPLSAADVLTAIALLNMLIFPMNALPWVINGFFEARVSLRRLARVLAAEDGQSIRTGALLRETEPTAVPANLGGVWGREGGTGTASSAHEVFLDVPASVWSWRTSSSMEEPLRPRNSDASRKGCGASVDEGLSNPVASPSERPSHDDSDCDIAALEGAAGGSHKTDTMHCIRATTTPDIDTTMPSGNRGSMLEGRAFYVQMKALQCRGGDLWAVVGPTGSGKSSLLLGILGEMRGHNVQHRSNPYIPSSLSEATNPEGSFSDALSDTTSGRSSDVFTGSSYSLSVGGMEHGAVELHDWQHNPFVVGAGAMLPRHTHYSSAFGSGNHSGHNGISYCPQLPSIHTGSVRANILMGSALEQSWYDEVLDGCCLADDLRQVCMCMLLVLGIISV